MRNKEEGNLVSFRIFLARDGNIISEFSYLPLNKLKTVFRKKEDIIIMEKIIREGCIKLEPLHNYLEKEVQAIQGEIL